MMRTLVVRRRARVELIEASIWYNGRRAGLGDEFAEAFSSALTKLRDNPLQYQLISGSIRQVQLRNFPYVVLYAVDGNDVVILSCFDARSDPGRRPSRA